MYGEGIDPHSLRWVREGHGVSRHVDPYHGLRNSGRGLGIPPPDKFRSSVLVPRRREDTESGSDMDESSDTEVGVYGRYSVDSSPRDDVSRKVAGGASGVGSQYCYYSSDVNSEFSSSVASNGKKLPMGRNAGRVNAYVVEEEDGGPSDSGRSSEFTSRVDRRNGGGAKVSDTRAVPSRTNGNAVSERTKNAPWNGYYSEISDAPSTGRTVKVSYAAENNTCDVPYKVNVNGGLEKVKSAQWNGYYSETSQQTSIREDVRSTPGNVPTAPPMHGFENKVSRSRADISNNSGVIKEATADVRPDINSSSLHSRNSSSAGAASSLPARVPAFHASGLGPWHSVIAYDACVRLCLHSWARGCMEAPVFLENECALMRISFGLQQVLLQSEEELLAKKSSELVTEGVGAKTKKMIGKMKVQVRKVRMGPDMPTGCSFSSLTPTTMVKLESFRHGMSNLQSTLSTGWESIRKIHVFPQLPANSSFTRQSLAYMHASAQYIKQVSGILKVGATTLRSSSSYETVQETYCCQLRLKSSPEEDSIKMLPGSGETHILFPDSLGDDLIIAIFDSKGKPCGRTIVQMAGIAENTSDKVRWWPIYQEPEHEIVGRIHLSINYTTADENTKCGSVAETVAYDIVLETAMKVQHFQQRNLLLHGSWKWLLTEFASYYGVSEAYTKLRYLSYVMDVATPTADCLTLVHDMLLPVVMKSRGKSTLSHQENRILGEIMDQIEQILALVFENYKSLDESLPSGIIEVSKPATGTPAPALVPAIKLYTLLHDVLSPEAQLKLCGYFQVAAKKRSRRHLHETDEYIVSNTEASTMDVVGFSTAYDKMRSLCCNIRNEIFTDINIHNEHVLPSFVDLPNLTASIYSAELSSRLRAFLIACPPSGPSPPVADLVNAAADFQNDLSSWNLGEIKGALDAKELFHLHIMSWIQDKRLALLEICKLDTVKWAGVRTQHLTTPFADSMYDRLQDVLNEYEVVMCRWPEYTFVLENAIADIEKATVEALEKQYADVLAPLKDTMASKKFGLKYVQKLANRSSVCPYTAPDELGVVLNTMKRLLDVLRPKIEMRFKSWGSCISGGGNAVVGERLSEVTVMLRAKFRNYLQAVVEKLVENIQSQSATKLKKVIKDSKNMAAESDIRDRMQPLKDHLIKTVNHIHTVFEIHVFVAVCRGFWDRMGQDVNSFLENRKENRAWYKGARVAVSVLDDTFASQMQQLVGNALQEKDLEPPRSIMEVRSVLCKDAPVHSDSNFFY